MDTTPIERLRIFIDHLGLSPHSFALTLGYASSEKIARLFRRKGAKPSYDVLKDVSNKFEDLNFNWLMRGNGEMLLSSEKTTSNREKTVQSVLNVEFDVSNFIQTLAELSKDVDLIDQRLRSVENRFEKD